MSELGKLIEARVAAAGGWLSFENFMQAALHEPGLGYYASPELQLGRRGDFTTAAETSELFGRALARFVAASLPAGGALLELGGGSGKLMASLLAELDALGLRPEARFLETSPALAALQRATLEGAGLAGRCRWLGRLPEKFVGVMVAVEVLDAVPCQAFVLRADGWRERGVAADEGGLAWADGPKVADAALDRLGALGCAPGHLAERSRQAAALTASLVSSLAEGVLLLIDYGHSESELYVPQRSAGTLRAYHRQQVVADVLARPGEQDITAHVDFSAAARAGTDAGAQVEGFCTQQAFLLDLGITELAAPQADAGEVEVYATSQQLQTLLMPHEMGEIFKVLALGRNAPSPLPGFGLNDRAGELGG